MLWRPETDREMASTSSVTETSKRKREGEHLDRNEDDYTTGRRQRRRREERKRRRTLSIRDGHANTSLLDDVDTTDDEDGFNDEDRFQKGLNDMVGDDDVHHIVLNLRGEVTRLRREMDRVRRELDELKAPRSSFLLAPPLSASLPAAAVAAAAGSIGVGGIGIPRGD